MLDHLRLKETEQSEKLQVDGMGTTNCWDPGSIGVTGISVKQTGDIASELGCHVCLYQGVILRATCLTRYEWNTIGFRQHFLFFLRMI